MNDKLTKPTDQSFALQNGKLRSKASSLSQRVNSAKNDGLSLPNRIILALDCSGSMRGDKIDSLKKAVANFVRQCSPTNTSLGLRTFGLDTGETSIDLTTTYFIVSITTDSLKACGSTPLYNCLDAIIMNIPTTRVVLISDGCPTDRELERRVVEAYKESKLPIDCVHIGDDESGESELRMIARETGGLYIKFTDVHALEAGLSYLTPSSRALLTSGQVSARELGAREVKK